MISRSCSPVRPLVLLTWAATLQAKTLTLGSSDNRTDVSLNLGDTLVVELSSGDVKRLQLDLASAQGLRANSAERRGNTR